MGAILPLRGPQRPWELHLRQVRFLRGSCRELGGAESPSVAEGAAGDGLGDEDEAGGRRTKRRGISCSVVCSGDCGLFLGPVGRDDG